MRQLLFERGCLESPTAKLTKPEAAKLLGNIWRKISSPSWPSSYNVPDRASRTRRKRHREYSWGFSKMHYRRKNQQNGFTKGIDPFVKRFSLCCGLSSRTNSGYDCFHGMDQTHSFARRARDHARIYRGEYSVASIIDIERIRKKKKSHRGALDQSTSFVSQEVEETAGQFKEAEDAFERSLDAQQHTHTTTTT